jgi:hypothetical protein
MSELYDNGISDNTNIFCAKCKQVTNYQEFLDTPGGFLKKHICENCGNTYNYPEDAGIAPLYERHVYERPCEGHDLMVLTQADRSAEYITDVIVICPIHQKEVNFGLPVN